MAEKSKKKKKDEVRINVEGNVSGNIIVGDHNTIFTSAVEEKNYSRFLVPFPHNPDFVGRDVELASLHEMLQKKESIVGIRPTVLVGLGGIGKTQLAVEYAHAHRDDYPSGVFWLNAINPLLIEFSDLSEKLEMSDRDTPRDKAARKAWDYLDAHPDALVIFDNVLEPSELNQPFSPDLIPANLRCRTLFTTRQRDFPRTFQPFEVKVLPEMAAMKLLLRSRSEVLEEHHPEWGWARIVCAELGWLPLALELAAAYLGAYPEVSITGYLERLRTEGSLDTVDASEVRAVDLPTRVEEILKAAAAGNLEVKHQVAVSATLQTQWKRLDDEDTKLLFRAAGQFPEASWIPIPRLGLLTGIESEAKAGRPSPLNVVLKKLHAVSLIEELSDDRLRLHPLVQEFAASLSLAAASFRMEMAKRVAAEFDDLLRVQARLIRFGVDGAIEDLRTALGFCIEQKETETYSHIAKMERVLDRQAYGLRNWKTQEQPAFFLQQLRQIRNEPYAQNLEQWQMQAEVELVSLKKTYLLERFPIPGFNASTELRTLKGHESTVNCVALNADGQLAVSGSEDGTLRVWNTQIGRELHTYTGHKRAVNEVAMSADGRLAISLSFDALKVWDVSSGRELRTLKGSGEGTGHIALSADGMIAISEESNNLIVWDVATGSKIYTLLWQSEGIGESVRAVALSADGRFSISASGSALMGPHCILTLWDMATGRKLRTLRGHDKVVSCVAISPNGNRAVSASYDNTLKVWDLSTGRELYTLKGHEDVVKYVAIFADGHRAVSASSDDTLKIWDLSTGRQLCTLTGHLGAVQSVAVSANGQLAISASSDNTLKVWDISEVDALDKLGSLHKVVKMGYELLSHTGRNQQVSVKVALSTDGRLALSASHNMLKVWDVASWRELHKLAGHRKSITYVALSADGRLAVSISDDGILKVWDVEMGRELQTLKMLFQEYLPEPEPGQPSTSYYVKGVVLSIEGQRIISFADLVVGLEFYASIKVWDMLTGCELHKLNGHTGPVEDVALSRDGQLAVSASDDKTIKVWDVATGNELRTLTGHDDVVYIVQLSADGRLVLSASYDETIKVWDVATGNELRTFTGYNKNNVPVILSPNGQIAVLISDYQAISVLDISSGICIATLLVDFLPLSFNTSADGKNIIVGDSHGGLHLIEVVGAGEIPIQVRKEVETRSSWLSRWVKKFLGRK